MASRSCRRRTRSSRRRHATGSTGTQHSIRRRRSTTSRSATPARRSRLPAYPRHRVRRMRQPASRPTPPHMECDRGDELRRRVRHRRIRPRRRRPDSPPPSYSPTLAGSTTYFWRVTARNASGSTVGSGVDVSRRPRSRLTCWSRTTFTGSGCADIARARRERARHALERDRRLPIAGAHGRRSRNYARAPRTCRRRCRRVRRTSGWAWTTESGQVRNDSRASSSGSRM